MVVDVAREKLWWDTGEADLVVQENASVVSKVSTLMNQYRDLFVHGSNDELGRTSVTEHSIDTGENRPIKQRPYRTPVHLQGEVNKQVNDMLKRGLIRPSDSPWSSPIVLAPKIDGTYRFCVDFRRVNTVTRKDAHPMPRVDDILTFGRSPAFHNPRSGFRLLVSTVARGRQIENCIFSRTCPL